MPKDYSGAEVGFKYNEVKNTFSSEERKLQDSLNLKTLDSQRVGDFNLSFGSVLESTKKINLSEIKVDELQKMHDPLILEKTPIKDKFSDLSFHMSKSEGTDLEETREAFVCKMAVTTNEVAQQSKNKADFKSTISDFRNCAEIKTPNYEKNSPEQPTLKTDNPKQSKEMTIQNISDDYPAKHSDSNEVKSSSNEISNLRNDFTNSSNQAVSLGGNSPFKTNNQKNSDPKFADNGTEVNYARTLNVNEPVKDLTVQTNERKSSEEVRNTSPSDCCSSDSDLDLDSLRNKFEEASDGTLWKIKSLKKEEAVFQLEWKVWLYECVVNIHVKNTILGESSITLMPCFDDPDEEFETLGYKVFQFFAKDEIVSFSLFSDKMIQKLVEYSNIAKRAETFMRDIMHVSLDGIHTLSDSLDPLELHLEILNKNHMSQLLIIFHVNLQTYPSEKIVPEVKHLDFKDITKEVKEAITNIEPGENYLWNMVKCASVL